MNKYDNENKMKRIKQSIINQVVKSLIMEKLFMDGGKTRWIEHVTNNKNNGNSPIYEMRYYAGGLHGWTPLIVLDPTKNNNEYDLYIALYLRTDSDVTLKDYFAFGVYSLHQDKPGAVSDPFRRAIIDFIEGEYNMKINDVFVWGDHRFEFEINEHGHGYTKIIKRF